MPRSLSLSGDQRPCHVHGAPSILLPMSDLLQLLRQVPRCPRRPDPHQASTTSRPLHPGTHPRLPGLLRAPGCRCLHRAGVARRSVPRCPCAAGVLSAAVPAACSVDPAASSSRHSLLPGTPSPFSNASGPPASPWVLFVVAVTRGPCCFDWTVKIDKIAKDRTRTAKHLLCEF